MDELSITRTIDLAAPRERVWAAVATAEGLASWFPDRVTAPISPGSRGALAWDRYGTFWFEILEVQEPDRLVFRWADEQDDPDLTRGDTTIEFTLADIPGGTRLTVVETGFESLTDARASFDGHVEGWESELGQLVALLGSL